MDMLIILCHSEELHYFCSSVTDHGTSNRRDYWQKIFQNVNEAVYCRLQWRPPTIPCFKVLLDFFSGLLSLMLRPVLYADFSKKHSLNSLHYLVKYAHLPDAPLRSSNWIKNGASYRLCVAYV